MKKTENTTSASGALGLSVLLGLVLTLLLMAAGALAVLSGKAEAARIPLLSLASLAAGSLAASFTAARKAPQSRLLWGLAAGGIMFACLALLSLAWFDEPVRWSRVAVNLGVALAASCAGGVAGASMKRKRRKK